jgi:hypothetical protein
VGSQLYRSQFATSADTGALRRTVEVSFYRSHRHRQPVRNVPVAQAFRNQPDYLSLAIGELYGLRILNR